MDMILGRFGDARLDKGGPHSSNGWFVPEAVA